jgi:acyl-CoA synthetase (AMP-forming)/AMP-acid ligase II
LIGWGIERAADRWGDLEVLRFGARRWTYAELNRWVNTVAADLLDLGLTPGDRLLWQLPNSPEALVLHFAAWRIGVLCVPVVPLYREHEMAQILRDARPNAVAFAAASSGRDAVAEMAPVLAALDQPPTVRIAVGAAREGWSSIRTDADLAPGSIRALPDPAAADEPCLLLYTSGTTSAPKGAVHSSSTLLAEAAQLRDAMGFSHRDVFIVGSPITHIAGLLLTGIVPAMCGARTAMLPKWDAAEAIRLCDEEGGTFSCGATVFLQAYVEHYEADVEQRLHRLSAFMCGGASIAPSLIERADRVGIRAFRSWGMTEAPTIGLVAPNTPLERRACTDGRAAEGIEVRAIDESGAVLGVGEVGELCVRAPEQMLCYTDPAVDAAHVDADGWFRTGDVGSVDADGWITMSGRIKDIINRGGEKFSAQDIEHAIASHDAVSSVAVLGVPDDRLGERVAAFVTLRDGAAWPGSAALVAHLDAQRLAKQKFPVEWRVLDELPATLSGKTKKPELLERWTRELAAAPHPDAVNR